MIIVEIIYKAALAEIDKYLAAHRDFLEMYYGHGKFLASGPKVPREGGIILALTDDVAELDEILAQDPFNQAGMVEYRYTQFQPVKHHASIQDLVNPC